MAEEEVIQEIIHELGQLMQFWGLSAIHGELWGTLYFYGKHTQEQLKQRVKCGTSTISQALTTLHRLGMVKIAGKNGRTKIYEAETSAHMMTRKKLENMLRFQVHPMTEFLNASMPSLSTKETKLKVKALQQQYTGLGTLIETFLRTK